MRLAAFVFSAALPHRLGRELHDRYHQEFGGVRGCDFAAGPGFDPLAPALLSTATTEFPIRWLLIRWASAYRVQFARHHSTVAARVQAIFERPGGVKLNIAALAREVGCSRGVLQRFLAETGLTIVEQRTNQRVLRVIHALRTGDDKVATMATDVGWKSRKDLYRAVRQRTRLSPAEIRTLPQSAFLDLTAGLVHRPALATLVTSHPG